MKVITFLLALSMAAGIAVGAQARSGSAYHSDNKSPKNTKTRNVPTWRKKYDRQMSRYEQHEEGCPCGTCKAIRDREKNKRIIRFGRNSSRSHSNTVQVNKKDHKNDENHDRNEDRNDSRRYRNRISVKKHSQPGHICRQGCAYFSYRRPTVVIHSGHTQSSHIQSSYTQNAHTQSSGFYSEYSPSVVKMNKEDFIPSIDVNRFQFDSVVRRRAYFISKEGIADELLAYSSSSFDEYLEYRSRTGEVIMAASPENTSRLLTILNDYETYRAYLAFHSGKTDFRVDVVSVVDRELMETDPESAKSIAAENVSNISNLLGTGKYRNKYSVARMWYNPRYGTVTIIDRPERIDRVKDLMLVRPYYLAQQ